MARLLQLRHQPPVPADHAPHQSFVAEMIEPALLAVALARGIDQREIARLVVRRDVLLFLREVERLQRHRDFFGETDADEAAGRDRVAVADQANRFLGADDLSAVRRSDGSMGGAGLAWLVSEQSRLGCDRSVDSRQVVERR